MIDDYLSYLHQKNYSSHTLRRTSQVLLFFSRWLWNAKEKTLSAAAEDDLKEYYLKRKKELQGGSLASMLGTIRGFYLYLVREEKIVYNPAQSIIPIYEKRILKDVPSEQTMKLLIDSIDECTYYGIRNKAILELMYSSGLRISELWKLNLQDVDLKEGLVRIHKSKGGSSRIVPMGRKAARLIQKYLEVTRPKHAKRPSEEALFLSARGTCLSDNQIDHILVTQRKRFAVFKGITPHSLRHACALHMLRQGAPIQSIQRLLGHKKLRTTEVYTKLHIQDLKEVHERYHPREKRN